MTEFKGEATQREKLKGIVEGIVNSVLQRLVEAPPTKEKPALDHGVLAAKLTAKVKPLIAAACDLGDEKGKTTPPKEIVAVTVNVQQAVNEFIEAEKLVVREHTIIGSAVRNLVQEAHHCGWEK